MTSEQVSLPKRSCEIATLVGLAYDFNPTKSDPDAGPTVSMSFRMGEGDEIVKKSFDTGFNDLGEDLLFFLECWIPAYEEFCSFLDENGSFDLDRMIQRQARLILEMEESCSSVLCIGPIEMTEELLVA